MDSRAVFRGGHTILYGDNIMPRTQVLIVGCSVACFFFVLVLAAGLLLYHHESQK